MVNGAALVVRERPVRDRGVQSRLSVYDHLLVAERGDLVMGDGLVRLYRLPNGYGLNGINCPGAHKFKYAWEFSVLEPDAEDALGFGDVVFDTPLTSSVKVCLTEEDALCFLKEAVAWASQNGQACAG